MKKKHRTFSFLFAFFAAVSVLATSVANAQEVGNVIFSLSENDVIQGLEPGTTQQPGFFENTPFQASGSPLFTILEHNGRNSIQVSDRGAGDWNALDLNREAAGIVTGYEYLVTVSGRVNDAPAGTQVIVGGAEGPHRWLGNAEPAGDGTFNISVSSSHPYFWSNAGGAHNRLRIQTNNTAAFIIDEVVITQFPGETDSDMTQELVWSLGDWLAGSGFAAGHVLPASNEADVTNAGSRLTVQENGALLIDERGGNDWAGADFRFHPFPTDLIVIEGSISPAAAGAEVVLQFPGDGHSGARSGIDAEGNFVIEHRVTESQAQSNFHHFRINSNGVGGDSDILITNLSVYRYEDAEMGESDPIDFPDYNFDAVPAAELGAYVLRVDIPNGNQWDGLRLSRAAFASHLTEDGVYEFSFDLFTPQSPAGVGLMLQTNGPRWAHLLVTPNFAPDATGQWTRFNPAQTFESRPNIANPINILSEDWTELQLVKRGGGAGGVNDGTMVTFFLDNFTITNTNTGEVAFELDFENGQNPFAGSPSATRVQIVPVEEAREIDFDDPEAGLAESLSLPSLHETWADRFIMGNIFTPTTPNDGRHGLLQRHFGHQITAENIMKPEAMQPTRGNFNFGPSRNMMTYAEDNDMLVVGHALVWHEQSLPWLTPALEATLSREEAIEIMQTHIRTVMEEFITRDAEGNVIDRQVFAWDVLNEAIQPNNNHAHSDWRNQLRDTKWLRMIGPEYISIAFHYAHEVDPGAILYYNDYNENIRSKATAITAMVDELRSEGVPIHRIGMQGHHNQGTNMESVRESIQMFIGVTPYIGELYRPIQLSVTELDITVEGARDQAVMPEVNAILQGQLYAQLFLILDEYSEHIERVTFWGMDDPRSWRADRHPNLFNGDLSPKPAFFAVLDPAGFLEEHPVAEAAPITRMTAAQGSTIIGAFDMSVWETASQVEIRNNLQAWNFPGGVANVMWDEEAMYVLVDVVDANLNATHANVWEHSSVEVFLSQTDSRAASYHDGDYQIRVNYQGLVTFGSQGEIPGLETAVERTSTGYRVEMRIPLQEAAYAGRVMGIDFQINYFNPTTNNRGGMVSWSSSMEDTRWAQTSNWGQITLAGDAEEVTVERVEYSASVAQLNGNTNDLHVTVVEHLSNGEEVTTTETFNIRNNAAGTYEVETAHGVYNIFVNTQGNTQIREIRLVD